MKPVNGLSPGVADASVVSTIEPNNQQDTRQPQQETEVSVQPRESDHFKLRFELLSHLINLRQFIVKLFTMNFWDGRVVVVMNRIMNNRARFSLNRFFDQRRGDDDMVLMILEIPFNAPTEDIHVGREF